MLKVSLKPSQHNSLTTAQSHWNAHSFDKDRPHITNLRIKTVDNHARINLQLPAKSSKLKMARILNITLLKLSVLLLLLILQLQILQVSSAVETHMLKPTADVSLAANTNQNHLNYLSIGKKPRFPVKRTLLKFEDIPESCMFVEKAELFIFYYEANKERWQNPLRVPFNPRTIEVRQVMKEWQEVVTTAITRLGTDEWRKTYLEYNDTDARKDADDSHTIYPLEPTGYIKFDITTTARKWCNGEENFGIILSAKNERGRGREIRAYSREKVSESGEQVRPYLTIKCWTDYCAPSPEKEDGTVAGTRGGQGGGGGGSAGTSIRMTSGNSEYLLPANSYGPQT